MPVKRGVAIFLEDLLNIFIECPARRSGKLLLPGAVFVTFFVTGNIMRDTG